MTITDSIPPLLRRLRLPRSGYAVGVSLLLFLLAAIISLSAAPTRADDSADPLAALKQFSDGSKALYHKISGSLIRIHMDVSRETLFNGPIRKEFEDWKSQHASEAEGGNSPRKAARKEQRLNGAPALGADAGEATTSTTTVPPRHPGQFEIGQLRKFYEQRQANLDPESLARFRLIIARADAARSGQALDFMGVMIDTAHHALVLFPLIAYPENKPFEVILPDGSATTATLNSTDYYRGMAVVTLASSTSPGNEPSMIPIASGAAAPGELLMAVGSSREQLLWTLASEFTPRKPRGGNVGIHPFAVKGLEDRSSAFLINTDAQLAGVAFERTALPYQDVQTSVEHLIKGDSASKGSRLGIKWAYVFPNSPDRSANPILGLRPAIRITEVAPQSPADRAGIKVDDFLLDINKTPINHLTQIFTELANHPQDITLTIVRKNEEQNLTVKFGP